MATSQPLHIIVDNSDHWTPWATALIGGFFAIAGSVSTLAYQKWARRRGKITIVTGECRASYFIPSQAANQPVDQHNAASGDISFEFDVTCNRDDPLALRDVHCELRLGARAEKMMIWDFHQHMANRADRAMPPPLLRTINVDGNHVAHFHVLGFIPKSILSVSSGAEVFLLAIDSDGNRYNVSVPRAR